MTSKKIVSIAVIVAIAVTMFFSSSHFINPLLVKASMGKARSSTGQTDYKDYQKCLAKGEGTKGYATKQS